MYGADKRFASLWQQRWRTPVTLTVATAGYKNAVKLSR
jgi:hypothetical protein